MIIFQRKKIRYAHLLSLKMSETCCKESVVKSWGKVIFDHLGLELLFPPQNRKKNGLRYIILPIRSLRLSGPES